MATMASRHREEVHEGMALCVSCGELGLSDRVCWTEILLLLRQDESHTPEGFCCKTAGYGIPKRAGSSCLRQP